MDKRFMILKNKNILITGAGKGIGFTCVETFLNEGAFVYALVKSRKDLKKFNKYNKNKLRLYLGNVNNEKLLNKIFLDSKRSKKEISCLINNAGVRFRKKFLKTTPKEIKRVFDTNFFSVFNLCQIFCRFLIKNRLTGSIVNISSIVGKIGFNELSVYASSKGAIDSLTKSLATEMSENNIRVNSISPGFTKSSFYLKFKKKKKLFNWTLNRTPMKRWAETSEISSVISFLISEKSSYINGENINVDGGWLSS